MNIIEYVVDRVNGEGVDPGIGFLLFVIAVIITFAFWRFLLVRKIRRQIACCGTYTEAMKIADYADDHGFRSLYAMAIEKQQLLFTKYLKDREVQFRKDLTEAEGSEEELLALLGYDRYGNSGDSNFTALVENEVRKSLCSFTKERIQEAESLEVLLGLCGQHFGRFWGSLGFNRVDASLKDVFLQKYGKLVSKEAIISDSPNDLCFQVDIEDPLTNALLSMKRAFLVISSQNSSCDLGNMRNEIDSALRKACE